jgi:hypothetical protein
MRAGEPLGAIKKYFSSFLIICNNPSYCYGTRSSLGLHSPCGREKNADSDSLSSENGRFGDFSGADRLGRDRFFDEYRRFPKF